MDDAPLLGTEDQKKEEETPWLRNIAIVILAVAAIGVLIYYWNGILGGCKAFLDMIGSWGLYSVPIIALCCALSTASCAPVVYVFELGAGAIYYNMTKSTGMALAYSCAACCPGIYLGSLIAFALGRKFLKPAIQKLMESNATLTIVNQIVSEEGWPFAFLLGMNPAIPFELLNYALSMTDLKISHFMLSTIGVMPVIAFETYTGVAVAAVANSLQGHSQTSIWEPIIQFSVAGVLIVGMGIYAQKKFNVRAEARRQEHRMVLGPHFLRAVTKFKSSRNNVNPAPNSDDRRESFIELHFKDNMMFMYYAAETLGGRSRAQTA